MRAFSADSADAPVSEAEGEGEADGDAEAEAEVEADSVGSGGAAMAVPEPCSMKAPAPMTAATGSARDRSRKEPRDLCPLMCLADGAEFFVVFLMASASQRHLAVRPRRRNRITCPKGQRPRTSGVQMLLVLLGDLLRLQLQRAVLDADFVVCGQAILDLGEDLLGMAVAEALVG